MERYQQINFVARGIRVRVSGPRWEHFINDARECEKETVRPHHPLCGSIPDHVIYSATRTARAEADENA